ncbi:hypothetical protein ACHAQA_000082 [Verticillium albo-atrum]
MASIRFSALLFAAGAAAQVQLAVSRHHDPFTATARRQVQTKTKFLADDFEYVVNVTVGTPPQEVSLAVNLFSYDSWVPDHEECEGNSFLSVCDYGTFDPFSSKSFVRESVDSFDEYYSSGYYVTGDTIRDTMTIGDITITNLTMGLGRQTNVGLGRLALGYNSSYSTTPTFLDRMADMGLINSTAFSLWPESGDAATGSLLLGAVDTSRYTGDLQRFQAYKYDMQYVGFYTQLASINGSRLEDASLQPLADPTTLPFVGISPPTLMSNLPWDVAQRIWTLARATVDDYDGQATVPCSWASNMTGQVALELGGVGGYILTANLSDLIIPQDMWSTSTWSWDTEEETAWCMFGVQSQNDSTSYSSSDSTNGNWVIGSTLLKNTYTVYDLPNEELAMAPMRTGKTGTPNIVSFESYGAEIPGSKKVGEDYCWSYQTCDNDNGNGDGGYGGGGNGDGYYYYEPGLQPWQKIVIGATIGGAALVIAALATWAFLRCRRIRKAEAELGKIEHPPGMLVVWPGGLPAKPAAAITQAEVEEPAPPLPPRPTRDVTSPPTVEQQPEMTEARGVEQPPVVQEPQDAAGPSVVREPDTAHVPRGRSPVQG